MLYDKIQEEKLSKVETNDNKTGLKAAVSSLVLDILIFYYIY